MSNPYRRYEILLPLQFNDGEKVPEEFFSDVLLELRTNFGAASTETQPILGHWQHEGTEYRDELIKIFVDVPDLLENRAFFQQYKESLKERFRQIDIWLTTYPVDVI